MDVGELTIEKYKELLNLTLPIEEGGYMRLYLDLCFKARKVDGKPDFVCDVETYESDGKIFGWVICQDLLYRREDYIDLSVYVDEEYRGMGIASRLLKAVEMKNYRGKNRKFSVWIHDEANKALYKKFNRHPFYYFDSNKYIDNEAYVRYDFDSWLMRDW